MSAADRIRRYAIPGCAALLLLPWLASVGAQDEAPLDVARVRAADGREKVAADLAAVKRFHDDARRVARRSLETFAKSVRSPRLSLEAVDAGIPSSRSTRSRVVTLARPAPEEIRRAEFYFVTVPRGGNRPRILPETLPERAVVLVARADSAEDTARLARLLNRPVSVTTAAFASALGVEALDAHVTLSGDGKTAVVEERVP